MTCENCQSSLAENYCPNCGKAARVPKINFGYLTSEVGEILMLEKGFFFTVKELLLRPGDNVQRFILKDRSRLLKPILFIVMTSLIYSLINYYFPFEAKYKQLAAAENYETKMNAWILANYGYSNLIMGVFIAYFTKLFFKKSGYNIFEILILICYTMGVGMLLLGIFGFLDNRTDLPLLAIGGIVCMLYISWANGQFFGKKFRNYWKAFAAYIIGTVTFFLVIFLLGNALDVIFRA